jgi:hypothetical protein
MQAGKNRSVVEAYLACMRAWVWSQHGKKVKCMYVSWLPWTCGVIWNIDSVPPPSLIPPLGLSGQQALSIVKVDTKNTSEGKQCRLTGLFTQSGYQQCIGRAPVARACNPNYSGGRDQEDRGLKPAWVNSSQDPISKKNHHRKGLVEWLKV